VYIFTKPWTKYFSSGISFKLLSGYPRIFSSMTTTSPGFRFSMSRPKKGTLLFQEPACKRGSLLSFSEIITNTRPVIASAWTEEGKDISKRSLDGPAFSHDMFVKIKEIKIKTGRMRATLFLLNFNFSLLF
jgi:hypothetical protein